jgi:hypothetical protein
MGQESPCDGGGDREAGSTFSNHRSPFYPIANHPSPQTGTADFKQDEGSKDNAAEAAD